MINHDLIIKEYLSGKSVWAVGKVFGIHGQTVHKLVTSAGVSRPINILSYEEKMKICQLYESGFKSGDGKLLSLCESIKRTKSFVCRYARSQGLTNRKRKLSSESIDAISENIKKWIAKNGHPKGSRGLKHSSDSIKKISISSVENYRKLTPEQKNQKVLKMLKTKCQNQKLITQRNKVSWKGGWREIGGKKMYLRSQWEEVYANYLEDLKTKESIIDWQYEADTFWFEKIKRGCRSYTPDFKVFTHDNKIEYHEVKGWMDDRSKTKLKRMRIYHPKVMLKVIDSKLYKQMFAKK